MKQPSLSEPTHLLTEEPSKPKFKALCENIFDVPRSGLLDVLETLQEAFWTDESDPSIYRPSPTTQHVNLDHNLPHKTTSKISPPLLKRKHLNKQATPTSPAGTYYIQPFSPPSWPSHDMTALKNSALAIAHKKSEQVALKKSEQVALKKSEQVALKKSDQVVFKKSVGATPTKLAAAPLREGRLKLWTVKWLLVKQLKSPSAEYKEKEVMALWQRFQAQGTPAEIRHLANYLYPVAYGMRRYTMAQSFHPLAE